MKPFNNSKIRWRRTTVEEALKLEDEMIWWRPDPTCSKGLLAKGADPVHPEKDPAWIAEVE